MVAEKRITDKTRLRTVETQHGFVVEYSDSKDAMNYPIWLPEDDALADIAAAYSDANTTIDARWARIAQALRSAGKIP